MVSIIGYTNSGKSTLMNALTGAGVLAEDKLFATLDPTTRKLRLPNNQNILPSDTVGLLRKLPPHLVESFKATLEDAGVRRPSQAAADREQAHQLLFVSSRCAVIS